MCFYNGFPFQNVLELTVCDDDIIRDDMHRIIFFDIVEVPLGELVFKTFELNPQVSMWYLAIVLTHSNGSFHTSYCCSSIKKEKLSIIVRDLDRPYPPPEPGPFLP